MMRRNDRQNKILYLIETKEIETQDELCNELNKLNYNVTQATVSRDIKDLKLFKIAGIQKKYRYAYVDEEEHAMVDKMHDIFKSCAQSIQYANNIVVLKTLRGNGATAGSYLDSLQMKEVLGSVAGDDTLIIIVDSNANAPKVADKLKELLM